MPKYHGYPNASNNQRKVLKQHLEKLRKEGLLRAAPFEEALQTSTKVLTANQDTLPPKSDTREITVRHRPTGSITWSARLFPMSHAEQFPTLAKTHEAVQPLLGAWRKPLTY